MNTAWGTWGSRDAYGVDPVAAAVPVPGAADPMSCTPGGSPYAPTPGVLTPPVPPLVPLPGAPVTIAYAPPPIATAGAIPAPNIIPPAVAIAAAAQADYVPPHWSEGDLMVSGQLTPQQQAALAARRAAQQQQPGLKPWQMGLGALLLLAAGATVANMWGKNA